MSEQKPPDDRRDEPRREPIAGKINDPLGKQASPAPPGKLPPAETPGAETPNATKPNAAAPNAQGDAPKPPRKRLSAYAELAIVATVTLALGALLLFMLRSAKQPAGQPGTPSPEPIPTQWAGSPITPAPDGSQSPAPDPVYIPDTTPVPLQPPAGILPLSRFIIGIDPGHQLKGDRGQEPLAPGSTATKDRTADGTQGIVSKRPEHELVLEIGLQLRDALIAQGATVLMSRETADVNISNMERATMMNDAQVSVCVRLHCDGSDNSKRSGMQAFVRETGPFADESKKLAQFLLSNMVVSTNASSLGISKSDNYTGLNWSEVPCVLLEMGFMSNPEEDELLNTPEYQQKIVDGIVQGLMDYLLNREDPMPR